MTVHGIVEIKTAAAANQSHYGEIYVSLCNFLSSSQAQSIGITRIAYNKGGAASGNGLDYPGSSNAVGNNAWSVWCWTSASLPFYMLLQFNSASGMNTAPGAPGAYVGTAGVGAMFAYLGNGSTGSLVGALSGTSGPWNGTTLNNGSDTKGSPVFQTGSQAAPSGTLYIFPRNNSGGGTNAALRNYLGNVTSADGGTAQYRTHFVCDENNALFLTDWNNDSAYTLSYFGKYTQRPGADPRSAYVQLIAASEFTSDGLPRAVESTTHGNTTYSAAGDGGIAYPWSSSVISGSVGVVGAVLGEIFSTTFQPNLSTKTLSYDMIPLELMYNESPTYGYAGSINFFKLVYGVATHDTNATLTSASFGAGTLTTYHKVVIPWDGITVPGAGASRTGSIF